MVFGRENPMQFDDVLVVQLMKHCNLAIGPLRINIVHESIKDLLEGSFMPSFLIYHFPHMPVCSTAQQFLNLKELKQLRVYFFTHIRQMEINFLF